MRVRPLSNRQSGEAEVKIKSMVVCRSLKEAEVTLGGWLGDHIATKKPMFSIRVTAWSDSWPLSIVLEIVPVYPLLGWPWQEKRRMGRMEELLNHHLLEMLSLWCPKAEAMAETKIEHGNSPRLAKLHHNQQWKQGFWRKRGSRVKRLEVNQCRILDKGTVEIISGQSIYKTLT